MFTELEGLGGKKAGREDEGKELELAERVREAGGRRGVKGRARSTGTLV